MFKLIAVLSAVFLAQNAVATNLPISTLPLGTGSAVGSSDSLPYTNVGAGQPYRLLLDDLVNLPAFQTEFSALVPMTTLGDLLYENATPVPARLAGNITSTKNFLCQTGTGSVSAAPSWCTIASGDVPNNAANTSGSAGSFTGSLIGDVSGTQSSTSVNKINGISLAGLATGLLKNTTTTGVPSIATYSDVVALFSTCSGTQYLGADGNCHNSSSGSVTSISVSSSNGLAGTSSGGATPALTLSTSVTGMVKGNGTSFSAATSGTDYAPGTSANATGIVKSTTTTGALTAATSSDVIGLFSTCSGTQYLGADGSCHTPSAGFTNPMTTLGDIMYEDATPVAVRLAGNTTTTKKFLTQTGTGSVSAAPAWGALASGDIPNNAANTSGSAGSLSSTLIVGQGGTGDTSLIAYAPVVGGTVNSGALQSASSGQNNSGYVLTSTGAASVPTWQAPSVGTVTSVAATVPSVLSISGSPITSSGTLAIGYSGTALPIANGGTGKTSVTTAPTASSWAGWDANSNLSANNALLGYATTATAASTTTLTVASAFQQYFTGTTTQIVVLPVTSTMALGQSFILTNNSTGVVTVESSGANVINYLNPGQTNTYTVILTTGTTAASWNVPVGQIVTEQGGYWLGSVVSPETTSCTWPNTSTTTPSNLAAVSACPVPTANGLVSAPATKIPAVVIPNQGPGIYRFVAKSAFYSTANTACAFRFSDGTNNTMTMGVGAFSAAGVGGQSPTIEGEINYTGSGPAAGTTVQIQSSGSNASDCNISIANAAGSLGVGLEISVYYFPTVTQLTANSSLPSNWSGYQTVSGGWVQSGSSFGAPSAGSGIVTTQLTGNNVTCVSDGTAAGISCSVLSAGTYHVCAAVNMTMSANSTPSMQLVDGSGNLINKGVAFNAPNANYTGTICGDYKASVGTNVFQIYLASNAGSITIQDTNAITPAINWTVDNVNPIINAATFVGAVTSTGPASYHVEYLTATAACTSSPCTIVSSSGSWFSTVSRNSTGNYTVNINSGEFSTVPACVISTDQTTGFWAAIPTATSFQFTIGADGKFAVQCMGH